MYIFDPAIQTSNEFLALMKKALHKVPSQYSRQKVNLLHVETRVIRRYINSRHFFNKNRGISAARGAKPANEPWHPPRGNRLKKRVSITIKPIVV